MALTPNGLPAPAEPVGYCPGALTGSRHTYIPDFEERDKHKEHSNAAATRI